MPSTSPGPGVGSPTPASAHVPTRSIDDHRRPSLPARPERAAARAAPASTSTSAPSTAPGSGLPSNSGSASTSAQGHIEPTEEITEPLASLSTNGNTNGHGRNLDVHSYGSNVMRRPSKNLPQPPVLPVMPDFEDLVAARRRGSSSKDYLAEVEAAPGAGNMKRKTSVVKKLKERVSK